MATYRRRRAACPQGPTYCTYWVRVPASAVPYVPRTVAPQVAMPVAAGLTQLCSSVPPLQALALLGSLLALELLLYFACDPPSARGCCRCARAKAAARVSHAPSQQALRQALLDGKHGAHVRAVDPRTEAVWGLSSNIGT